MCVLVKNVTKAELECIIQLAKIGANNCMIGEGLEIFDLSSSDELIAFVESMKYDEVENGHPYSN